MGVGVKGWKWKGQKVVGKAKRFLSHKARLYLLDNDAVALLGPRQLVSLAEERVKGLVDAVRGDARAGVTD